MVLETMQAERSDFARPRFVLRATRPADTVRGYGEYFGHGSEKSLLIVHIRLP